MEERVAFSLLKRTCGLAEGDVPSLDDGLSIGVVGHFRGGEYRHVNLVFP